MSARLAERVATQLRAHLPAARRVPVDVEDLARSLGVGEIIDASGIVEDGRLELRDGHVRVVLSGRGSEQRRRYTLAHEIGHLLLADPQRDTIARRMTSDDEVERFCDSFAAALLLPKELLEVEYRSRPHALKSVRRLAAQCDVSLAAATVRLNEVAGWSHALLHWKRSDRGWQYRWGAGVPVRYYRRLRSAPDTSERLDLLASRTPGDQAGEIPMRVGPDVLCLRGEVSIRGSSAVALLAFSRPERQVGQSIGA